MAGLSSETCPECGLEQARWVEWDEPVASSAATHPRLIAGLRMTASLGAAVVLFAIGGKFMRAMAFVILALWIIQIARQTIELLARHRRDRIEIPQKNA